MKILTLIRHASAYDKLTSQTDSERNLSVPGQLEAMDIAQQLWSKRCLPDTLLCSPAKRTLQTAAILCRSLQFNDQHIKIDETIYSGDLDTIVKKLYRLNTAQHLFVIGHNPKISALAHRFCEDTKTITLPPAGVISLEFSICKWDELATTSGKLLFFITPHHEAR